MFVRTLALNNFRCLPDGVIGPFKSFNLIFGRNGAGKTSLLEALEACITGDAWRVERLEDITKVLGRDGDLEIRAYDSKNIIISELSSTGLVTSPVELLERLYGIGNVDGRKARYLLPQMFRTHNILYSDRIVLFLAGKERKELSEVFRELTLGRNIIEIWDRIRICDDHVRRRVTRLQEEIAELKGRRIRVQEQIAAKTPPNLTLMRASSNRLQQELPPKFRSAFLGDSASDEVGQLAQLREVRAGLDRTRECIDRLRIDRWFAREDFSLDWAQTELNKQAGAVEEAVAELAKTQARLVQLEEKLPEIQLELQKVNQENKDLTAGLQKIVRAKSELETLSRWVPAFQAAEKETSIRDRVLRELETRERFEAIHATVGKIESREEISKLVKMRQELSFRLQAETRKLQQFSEKARVLKEQLEKLVARQEKERAVNRQMYELLTELRSLSKLTSEESRCPACGHEWESQENLLSAMENQLDELGQGFDRSEADKRASLKTALSEISSEEVVVKTSLDNLRKELSEVDTRNYSHKRRLTDLSTQLEKIEDPELKRFANQIEGNVENVESACGRLLEGVNASVRSLQSKLEGIWKGIGRDAFRRKEKTLRQSCNSLNLTLQYLDLGHLDIAKASSWKAVGSALRRIELETQDQINRGDRHAEKVKAKVDETIAERERLSRGPKRLTERKDKLEEQIERLNRSCDALKVLVEWGFAHRSQKVDIDGLLTRTQNLLVSTDGSIATLERFLEWKSESDTLRQLKMEIDGSESRIVERLSRYQSYSSSLKSLTPPDEFEMRVWEEYSSTVSRLFRKLHWPPDYAGIELLRDDSELTPFVRLRNGEQVPAHYRMSAGQRAALAISVFWAFNTSPNVPAVLIMDEPIQSIDDLNMLNFLDSLRWLVENVDRQVFLTTANQRVQSLVRRKFSYLKDEYLELSLTRSHELSELRYLDHRGEDLDRERIA